MRRSEPGAGGAPGARRRIRVLWLVAAVAYALDLGSEVAVVAGLEGRDPVPVLGSWLELRVQRNPGAAFGMGSASTIVFTLIALAVVVVVVRVARRLTSTPWAIALGLLLGGAVGDLTDRLFRSPGGMRGAVVDFVAVRDVSVMNLADWAISCGSVLIVVLSFRGHDRGTRALPGSGPTGGGPHTWAGEHRASLHRVRAVPVRPALRRRLP
ncbi:signal peptidase II [Streptomyces misionensis]|uniref:signal peptidase II n=1 Tax=Streptomyces misionensis TaxID=67331 RepID=UPI0021BD3C91|nr:signal peptidase II [Streptomyces misionensis]